MEALISCNSPVLGCRTYVRMISSVSSKAWFWVGSTGELNIGGLRNDMPPPTLTVDFVLERNNPSPVIGSVSLKIVPASKAEAKSVTWLVQISYSVWLLHIWVGHLEYFALRRLGSMDPI